MNFSIALIAKNESKTLPKLMGSLKEFQSSGGKIYLLDTGSTDNTVEVAMSFGCFVYEVGNKFLITLDADMADSINHKFITEGEASIVKAGDKNFDYASARNYIAELAESDMVAMPDCDEMFTVFDIDALEKVINEGSDQLEYNFVFAHDDFGKPLIQFQHTKFYNKKKMQWVGIIHEVLQSVTPDISIKKTFLNESIIKLEHWQNPETDRTQYLTGLAIDCYTHPENDRNSHYFARELMYKGRYHSAIKEFKRHIAMNKWQTERAQSMIFIGDCYSYLGNGERSHEWYIRAFEAEPNRREPLMKLAEYFYFKGLYQQTIAFCKAALEIRGISYYSNHQPYYEQRPHELLYWGYWYLGQKEKAKEHFIQCIRYQPDNEKFIREKSLFNLD